jgi:ABC-type sulfate transport system substrate-binding protein
LLDPRWQSRRPNNSRPFCSFKALLGHQGKLKNNFDWNDLARPGVSVLIPSPKISGSAIFDRVWKAAQR